MTIAGSDSGGGAGVQADARTFAALGVYGTSVITAITAQNTLGVLDVYALPVEAVNAQMNAVLSDIDIRSVKTGMLATVEIAEAVVDILSRHEVPIVVDPVMAAEAGGTLVIGELKDVLARLLPEAEVATPNIQEAEAISGVTIHSLDDMKHAAYEIYGLGPKSVVVTGGHLTGTDVLYDGDFELLRGKLIKGGTHGAGCTFSAAVAAFLAEGHSVSQSALMAKAFVTDAIKNSERVGAGSGAVNQVAATLDRAERYVTLLDVEAGLRTIKTINLNLIPEVGSNLAMAISRAKKLADVAAVRGRITKVGEAITPVGCVAFGASRHMARIILAALQYDPNMKSAMSVRCSDEVIDVCRELNLVTESFDIADAPGGVRPIEWAAAHIIERSTANGAGVPDVIYDRGGVGKEPMARILGHSAQQVAETVVKISSMLK
ncbi:MAG: bifunctional hydroxymethylpyrimidine kinase/phosphomethylpyrimidine kinase [Halobacteriota archaeon]